VAVQPHKVDALVEHPKELRQLRVALKQGARECEPGYDEAYRGSPVVRAINKWPSLILNAHTAPFPLFFKTTTS
jgi:hypothetical protein